MPWGMEAWLGITGEDRMREAFKAHQLPDWPLSADPDNWYDSALYEALPDLTAVHVAILTQMGFTDIVCRDGDYDLRAVTPLGPRTFCRLSWGINFDPDEAGDEPNQAVFGVALTSRYCPTLVDWQSPHGAIEPIVLDDTFMQLIATARTELGKLAPIVRDMQLVIIQKWY